MSWKNKMESVSPPWECSQNKFGRRHVYWDHALYTKSLNWLFLYSFVFLSFLSTFLKKGQAKTQGKCKLLGHPRLKVPTVPQRPAEGAPKTGSNFLRGSHWVQIFALLPHCPDHRGGGGVFTGSSMFLHWRNTVRLCEIPPLFILSFLDGLKEEGEWQWHFHKALLCSSIGWMLRGSVKLPIHHTPSFLETICHEGRKMARTTPFFTCYQCHRKEWCCVWAVPCDRNC